MNFIEKVGKNLESITTDALIELGATRDQVTIEVLEKGSKGFFGFGAKDAKVRVTLKAEEPEINTREVVNQKSSKIQEVPQVQKESKLENKPIPISKEAKVVDKPASQVDIPIKLETKQKTQETVQGVVEPILKNRTMTGKKIPIDATEAVLRAKTFLENVLREMHIEPTFEVKVTDRRINIVISGDKMGLVIGKRGETLDALQYLVNIVVNKGQEGYVKVMLDTENYRARREETLRKVALKFAKKVSETKKPVALEPMNPYDRRIIHSVLQNSKIVKTHSEGREPFRKVVIAPIDYNKTNKRQ